MANESLRRGDLVEVLSASEILATLDGEGALAGLLFMPEMAAFCGRRFVVDARTERVCDTIEYKGNRRLQDGVYLADLRCDGAAHGGCQAECRFYWKEAWLRKVSPAPQAPMPGGGQADGQPLLARATRGVKRVMEVEGRQEERWRCQATDLPGAGESIRLLDLGSYLREFTTGNVTFGQFLRVTSRAAVTEPMRKLGLVPEVALPGTRTEKVVDPPLHLQPGELVEVKSPQEIAATLSPQGKNRGLWFDREMLPFCGRTFRVRQRIQRIIDERDGRMIEFKTDCVTLDGVVCSGDHSTLRWFCRRAIYSYWREAWLRRVEPARVVEAGRTAGG
jgi:hypothetical protein